MHTLTVGTFLAISRKVGSSMGSRENGEKNIGIVGMGEGKPKVWEMAQKLPVRPME